MSVFWTGSEILMRLTRGRYAAQQSVMLTSSSAIVDGAVLFSDPTARAHKTMSDVAESTPTEQTVPVVPASEHQSAPQPESKPEQPQADPAPQKEASPKPAEKSREPVKQQPVEVPKPEPKTESTKRFWNIDNNYSI